MSRDQGLPSDIRAHVSIASNEARQDREDRLTRRALNASDGETAEANPNVMGVAGEAATFVAGRLVVELKAQREDESPDDLDKGLAVVKELEVGGIILEIDGEGAVFTGCFSGLGPVSSPCRR